MKRIVLVSILLFAVNVSAETKTTIIQDGSAYPTFVREYNTRSGRTTTIEHGFDAPIVVREYGRSRDSGTSITIPTYPKAPTVWELMHPEDKKN